MRHLFAVPWLTPIGRTLLGIGVVAILVFGLFALLKVTNGGRQAPAKELITGSEMFWGKPMPGTATMLVRDIDKAHYNLDS